MDLEKRSKQRFEELGQVAKRRVSSPMSYRGSVAKIFWQQLVVAENMPLPQYPV
jgi:hypothetical protein